MCDFIPSRSELLLTSNTGSRFQVQGTWMKDHTTPHGHICCVKRLHKKGPSLLQVYQSEITATDGPSAWLVEAVVEALGFKLGVTLKRH